MTITFDHDVLLLQELEDLIDKAPACEARVDGGCSNAATHWVICPRCNDHKAWCVECVALMKAQHRASGLPTISDLRCGKRFPPEELRIEPIA